jgi:hypothetical protein
MMVATTERSLYEDWLVRRDRLAHDTEGIEQYRRIQLQLLNYLLERYRDAPQVQQPALFPLTTEVILNERAMVVHNHLWRGQTSGTKSTFEVKHRVSAIVERMQASWGDSTAPFSDKSTDEAPDDPATALPSFAAVTWQTEQRATEFPSASENEQFGRPAAKRGLRLRVRAVINSLRVEIHFMAWTLAGGLTGAGARRQIEVAKACQLLKKFARPPCRDEWLLVRLQDCEHPYARRAAFQAWLDRIRAGCNDEISHRLQRSFGALDDGQLDSIRALLVHPRADVRIIAMEMLATHGTLDDVSLLCDLLDLPVQPDEHPRERASLGLAARRIAEGRNSV